MKLKLKAVSLNPSRILIGLFSIFGLGIMSYLTYISYAQTQSFCDISEEVSCDIVITSIYSEIFGIPVAILGLVYFLIVLLLTLFNRRKEVFRTIFFLTLFVFIPSLYLTALELFVIKSICILCESSKVLMLAILITSFLAMRAKAKTIFWMSIPVVIAGLAATGIMYFAQTGGVTQEDHSEFISCLNEKGVVYYKSVRCSNCRRQEKLLGKAYLELNSVECHPEGKNPQPEFCLEKGISKTPTFLLEVNGKELKRLIGIQQVEDLAAFADCPVEGI